MRRQRQIRRQGALGADFALTPDDEHVTLGEADGPEELFATQCKAYSLPEFERQLPFAKAALGRNWRFDFAWRALKVAVEIDGVAVQRLAGRLVVLGRHASIEGIRGDNEKLNAAALLGWSVLRFLQTDVKPKLAIQTTIAVLTARGWRPPT